MKEMLKKYKSVLIPLSFLLILPSLVMFILGVQFNEQVVERIPFGILDYDNSTLSRKLIKIVEDNNSFDVQLFAESDAQIEESILKGRIAGAIIIPEGFEKEIATAEKTPILAIYDNMQLVSAGTARAKMNEILNTLSMGTLSTAFQNGLKLSTEQGMALLQPLPYSIQQMNPGKSSIIVSLHGTMLNMIQICVFTLALEMTRKQDKTRPHHIARNALFCGFFGLLSAGMVTFLQVELFHFPFYGSLLAWSLVVFLYLVAIAVFGILIRLMSKEKEDAVQKISLLMMTMLLSGYSYPLDSMPKIFQMIGDFIPFSHYGMPLRSIMLMGYGLKDILSDLQWIMGYHILLLFCILFVCFVKKQVDNTNEKEKSDFKSALNNRKKEETDVQEMYK